MSPVISSDVSDDMAEEIEEMRDDGESRSAAVKRLLRAGLDAERSPDHIAVTYPAGVVLVGWFCFAVAFGDAIPVVGYLGIVLIVGGVLYGLAERRDWL